MSGRQVGPGRTPITIYSVALGYVPLHGGVAMTLAEAVTVDGEKPLTREQARDAADRQVRDDWDFRTGGQLASADSELRSWSVVSSVIK